VSNLNVSPALTRAVSTYAPLAFNTVGPKLTFNMFNQSGTMNVLFDAAGTLDLYPPQATVPVSATSSSDGSVGTVRGRVVPGGGSMPSGHQAPKARRG
jgi:hypothetical protein